MSAAPPLSVHLLDYGAGNVRSIRNALAYLGCQVIDIEKPEDINDAKMLIFPGVGSFGAAMKTLKDKKLVEPLTKYLQAGRPFLGVCLGMQLLFQESEESPGVKGLGVIPGNVTKFKPSAKYRVPHMGWNGIRGDDEAIQSVGQKQVYFVHSFKADVTKENKDWVWGLTDYAGCEYISAVRKGNVFAMQFHPEKSGKTGLALMHRVIETCLKTKTTAQPATAEKKESATPTKTELCNRVIACLDVRSNDDGDLVVTKGDCYDVREKSADGKKGHVRNLGKPVALAHRYYTEGADEITFLNITSFREMPATDAPMLKVLEETSKKVFVPLTIGGGIRDYKDSTGKEWSSVDVAGAYFRAGADKVSIGSDAVRAAIKFYENGKKGDMSSSIERISHVYGAQAVVISVDPRRVYTSEPTHSKHTVVKTEKKGPNGEGYCWFQCTTAGGRKGADLDVAALVVACEALGAGEILLNSIDCDGQCQGYDLELVDMVCKLVNLPVIASSGAGKPEHFSQLFTRTTAQAALASGIFHRREVAIESVKKHLQDTKHAVRIF
uniref:Imidazole glycerol phosphate synthase hisHF n=1 Tax=Lotharella globosa TaxID=91324 RepID=A0A7S3Z0Z5_9EUKA